MHEQHHASHLFRVRLWREDLGSGQGEWRGQAQHVITGQRFAFRDWTALTAGCAPSCPARSRLRRVRWIHAPASCRSGQRAIARATRRPKQMGRPGATVPVPDGGIMQPTRPIGIIGTGAAVPDRVVTNADLVRMVVTDPVWIETRTGIRERRIADEGTASSDLAVDAAQRAIAAAGISAQEIGLIVCATVTPDMSFPATACLVQHRLGARYAAAFDLSAGCSGFVYGLSCAVSMLQAGGSRYALVIGVDTLSKITDFSDRTTCVLFADGAGAVVLGPADAGRGFLSFELGADGGGSALIRQEAGGSRLPASHATVEDRKHVITMAGPEVFKFAVRILGASAEAALAKVGLDTGDIDLLIPHQANIRIIETAVQRLELPPEKVFVNLDRYGNTSSASIPLALDEAARSGRLRDHDVLVMVAFGAGLTWGATVMRW